MQCALVLCGNDFEAVSRLLGPRCVCVCVCVCVYVCVCMYVCMCVCIHTHMYSLSTHTYCIHFHAHIYRWSVTRVRDFMESQGIVSYLCQLAEKAAAGVGSPKGWIGAGAGISIGQAGGAESAELGYVLYYVVYSM